MELYCDICGAQFRNNCTCPVDNETAYLLSLLEPVIREEWRGMDGHRYIGDPKRASSAYHAEDCGCPGSTNFDPDSWY